MPKCTFCGTDIEKGTGKMFVYTSGKIANFCSNKCEKNLLKLKRKPLNVKWTAEYRKEHKKGQGSLSSSTESKKVENKKDVAEQVSNTAKNNPKEAVKVEKTENQKDIKQKVKIND